MHCSKFIFADVHRETITKQHHVKAANCIEYVICCPMQFFSPPSILLALVFPLGGLVFTGNSFNVGGTNS